MLRLKMNPIARAVGVFGAVAVVTTGVTFALKTNATISNNTVSAKAGLQVASTKTAGESPVWVWGKKTTQGLNFAGVVPGGLDNGVYGEPASSPFGIKNASNNPFGTVKLTINDPNKVFGDAAADPVVPPVVDPAHAFVSMTCANGAVAGLNLPATSVTALKTGVALTGLPMAVGAQDCTAKVMMDDSAFAGAELAATQGFDLVFNVE